MGTSTETTMDPDEREEKDKRVAEVISMEEGEEGNISSVSPPPPPTSPPSPTPPPPPPVEKGGEEWNVCSTSSYFSSSCEDDDDDDDDDVDEDDLEVGSGEEESREGLESRPGEGESGDIGDEEIDELLEEGEFINYKLIKFSCNLWCIFNSISFIRFA